ncbi:hypothetical protein BH09PLA1_BH09PLA1_23050 [soil metagenome]
MRNRMIPMVLSAMLVAPAALFVVGCDREVAHEEKTVQRDDGTSKHSETTVKEKQDGTIVKEHEEKVDNKPK